MVSKNIVLLTKINPEYQVFLLYFSQKLLSMTTVDMQRYTLDATDVKITFLASPNILMMLLRHYSEISQKIAEKFVENL